MADENDYTRKLEETLQEAGIGRTRPRPSVSASASSGGVAQAVPPSTSRQGEPDRATFSQVMAGMQELHKRLAKATTMAMELERLLTGEALVPANAPEMQAPEGASVFHRLAVEIMIEVQELDAMERSLDRALGALR